MIPRKFNNNNKNNNNNNNEINKLQFKSVIVPGGKYVTVDGWNPKLTRERLVEIRDLAATGALRPVIDRCYSLEELAEAHRYVETKRKRGNVMIEVIRE